MVIGIDCHKATLSACAVDALGAEVSAATFPLSVRRVDYDSKEGRRLALSGGMLFPPGIVIGGRAFSYGRPSERKLRRELAGLVEAVRSGEGPCEWSPVARRCDRVAFHYDLYDAPMERLGGERRRRRIL